MSSSFQRSRRPARLNLFYVALPWFMLIVCLIAGVNLLISRSYQLNQPHAQSIPAVNQPDDHSVRSLNSVKHAIKQATKLATKSSSSDISLVVLDSESTIVQQVIQSLDQSSNQLHVHVRPSNNKSTSLFELLIATIINRYANLPDAFFVLASNNHPNNQSISRMVHSSSTSHWPQFINLAPGSYQCHRLQSIDEKIVVMPKISAKPVIYQTQKSIDSSIDMIEWESIVTHQTVRFIGELLGNDKTEQSINQSAKQPIRFTCFDSAVDFVVRREAVQKYSINQYKSMLSHCRVKQSDSQSSDQSSNQCDLSYLTPLFFDRSIDSLFHPPLLASSKHLSIYQSLGLLTEEVTASLSLHDAQVGLSSRHPLYKRITNAQYKHNHFYLTMMPSPQEISIMQSTIEAAQNSEQMYEWMRLMPVGLDPPTVMFAIFVDINMKQRYNDTFEPQTISQLTNDRSTIDFMKKRVRMFRPDVPLSAQFIQPSCASIPSPATLFARYILWMYDEPELRATCVIAYLSSYGRSGNADQAHSDKLQMLLRAKWSMGESLHYIPLHVDSYTCESVHAAPSVDASIIQHLRQSIIDTIFPSYKGTYPSTFCFYSGGEFLTSRVALVSQPQSNWELLLHWLCEQQGTFHKHGVSELRMAELIEEAMIPIWQMLLMQVLHGSQVLTTVIQYQSPSFYLHHPSELPYLGTSASKPEEYHALLSSYHPDTELVRPQPNHWTDTPLHLKLKSGKEHDVTVALVVAAFNEKLEFVANIDSKYKRVIIRQDFPQQSGQTFVGVEPSVKQDLLAKDQLLTDSIHMSGTGMCREASSYIQYIIAYYDELPDYSIFIHGSSSAWHHLQPIEEVLNNLDWDYISTEEINFYHNLNSAFYTLVRPDHYLIAANHYFDMIGTDPQDHQRFFNGSDTLPEMIGYHQAAQFIVARSAIHRHPVRWWKHLYEWCRFTHLTPAIASRIMEYSWHWIMGRPPLEQRHECGTISRSETCTFTRLSD